MSALARYFLHEGKQVAGYDRTASELTRALECEGATVTYEDEADTIPEPFRDKADTLVVYTPAIPSDSLQFGFFRDGGFEIVKRSRMLGVMAEGKYLMAVAGTHGKTTTSTMAAWFDREAGGGGSAFLGGISKNFGSNLVLGPGERLVVEADEFDRSFLQLYPDVAVVTAVDADHLDIYGTHEAVKEAFSEFVRQIRPGGALILKQGVELNIRNDRIRVYRYAYDTPCDFYADRIRLEPDGRHTFDLVCPDRVIRDCTPGVPGWVNVENCVAAAAMLWVAGFDEAKLRVAIASFSGVKRRFDFYVNTPKHIYMDDYAHHPTELRAAITSVQGDVPGAEADGGVPAAPVHPDARFLPGVRRGVVFVRRGVAAADLSGARGADRRGGFRNAAAADRLSGTGRPQEGSDGRAEIEEPGIAGDVRGGRYRPLLHADRRFIRRKIRTR